MKPRPRLFSISPRARLLMTVRAQAQAVDSPIRVLVPGWDVAAIVAPVYEELRRRPAGLLSERRT